MPTGRRLAALLVALALVGVPPVVLRALCEGKTCAAKVAVARVPFCPLPRSLKTLLSAGFRSGRSPDVLGVTATGIITGGTDQSDAGVAWPAVSPAPDPQVPIAFFGDGVASAQVAAGTGLDQIAPSLADVLGFHRDHPDVRAGVAVPGIAVGNKPRLVVEIVWRGIGTPDLLAASGEWPYLRSLMHGSATMDGTTGSVPLDPAATLTTIGTGGLPWQHGITASLVRNDKGDVVQAWGPGSPASVISTLPDDLDFKLHEAPKIGLVAPYLSDRGIIGGTWYLPHDSDNLVLGSNDPLAAVHRLLLAGYGADAIPDVLAVVLQGPIRRMDSQTRAIVATVRSSTPTAFVVTATGTTAAPTPSTGASVAQRVDASVRSARSLVAAAVPGGLFLDQQALSESGLSSNAAVGSMLAMHTPTASEKLFADAFPGFAVSFARYC